MNTNYIEVLIIGGGPAGMGAALTLGRALISTLVISDEKPRNYVTSKSHNFLTRDGIDPKEFIYITKLQIEKYESIKYLNDKVIDAKKIDEGFIILTEKGLEFKVKKIIFATGNKDNLKKLNIIGLQDVYGKSVFPCPLCDGWEWKEKRLAVFGSNKNIVQYAKIISNWSKDIIIFTNGYTDIKEIDKKAFANANIKIVENLIKKIGSENGNLKYVFIDDGSKIERDGGFILETGEEPNTNLPEKLGVKTYYDESLNREMYDADLFGETDVEGVYVVGDAKDGYIGKFASAFEGSHCAKMLMYKIIESRWNDVYKPQYE